MDYNNFVEYARETLKNDFSGAIDLKDWFEIFNEAEENRDNRNQLDGERMIFRGFVSHLFFPFLNKLTADEWFEVRTEETHSSYIFVFNPVQKISLTYCEGDMAMIFFETDDCLIQSINRFKEDGNFRVLVHGQPNDDSLAFLKKYFPESVAKYN